MTLRERFEALGGEDNEEFLRFKLIATPLSERRDLCAFLLLDKLVPSDHDLIAGAEHDIYYFSVDQDALNAAATDEDVLTLIRCGVMWDEDTDGLAKFS